MPLTKLECFNKALIHAKGAVINLDEAAHFMRTAGMAKSASKFNNLSRALEENIAFAEQFLAKHVERLDFEKENAK